MENKDDLSQDQLTHLKDSLIQIKHYQNNLEDTLGAMKTKNLAIRVAREARDFDQLLVLYNEILQIQETRMTDLRLLTEHLNQLLTTFSV